MRWMPRLFPLAAFILLLGLSGCEGGAVGVGYDTGPGWYGPPDYYGDYYYDDGYPYFYYGGRWHDHDWHGSHGYNAFRGDYGHAAGVRGRFSTEGHAFAGGRFGGAAGGGHFGGGGHAGGGGHR
jgi:hypothetical protein